MKYCQNNVNNKKKILQFTLSHFTVFRPVLIMYFPYAVNLFCYLFRIYQIFILFSSEHIFYFLVLSFDTAFSHYFLSRQPHGFTHSVWHTWSVLQIFFYGPSSSTPQQTLPASRRYLNWEYQRLAWHHGKFLLYLHLCDFIHPCCVLFLCTLYIYIHTAEIDRPDAKCGTGWCSCGIIYREYHLQGKVRFIFLK